MTLTLKPLNIQQPIVDSQGRPTAQFQRFWQLAIGQIVDTVNGVAAAQAAAGVAQAAAATAQAAATTANTAAATANAAAAANAKENALINSYITPDSVLTATSTVISIAAHTRHYADGTSVAVNSGAVPATGVSDIDFVSYSDPTRAGGAVVYSADTVQPAQGNNIHVIGAVLIPASGSASGGAGPKKAGFVEP